MKYICPLITVSNMARSREFYENVLGQKVKHDFGENVTFQGDFAIHLDTHFSKLIEGKPILKNSNSFELYFEEDKIEELTERLEQKGVTFVHPLRQQPWKQLVVRFYDPDGNIIEVGESLKETINRLTNQGYSKIEIASEMGVTIDFIDALTKPN
jgi:catechol 2,3-dioxygenase-like lactoylglutathione lyase family enzyme